VVNGIAGWLLARLLAPFASFPPLVGLTLVSLITAALLLITFKWTSNQRAIAEAKRQVHAGLFELRLFQDDPRLMARAAVGLFAQQARYLRYAIVPMLWVSLPLSILLAHLQIYYGYEPLRPGQSTVVIAQTTDASAPPLTLITPRGLHVETPGVWAPSRREAAWRIAVDSQAAEGDYDLQIAQGTNRTESVTKRIRVTNRAYDVTARPAVRPAGRLWDEWLNPGESALPSGPSEGSIDAITIRYEPAARNFFGLAIPWLPLFLLLTMVFMLFGRRLFRVVV
jgi:hypothetical protein